MKVGFTGTRKGLLTPQREALGRYMSHLVHTPNTAHILEVHHGDCVGADWDFHDLIATCTKHGWFNPLVVIHPPNRSHFRAHCETNPLSLGLMMQILPEKEYHERNDDIVFASDFVIACPHSMTEDLAGGTHYTMRRTRQANKPLTIIKPNGQIVTEAKLRLPHGMEAIQVR